MSLKEQGVAKFGRLIGQNNTQAAHLTALIKAEPELELMAPTEINIVCFRYRGAGADEAALRALNTELILRLQESGAAVLSDTTVAQKHCLRIAINNHRTQRQDLDFAVNEVIRVGRRLASNNAYS
jgi:aromatic-L-amino-acid decarboxylase